MAFVHPGLFIAAVACVAIPILIHLLLRRRRKPVAWGAMRFLLEAYQKQRSKLKLQQIILLVTRCLVILLIGSAIAGPILERAGVLGGGSGRDIFLLIDNSVASTLREGGPSGELAIEAHKRAAIEIVNALGPGDRAGIITTGGPAQGLVVPASSDLSAVRDVIEAIAPTDSASDLTGALTALRTMNEQDEQNTNDQRTLAVIVSQFRKGSADIADALPPSAIELYATRPAASGASNVQIINVEPIRSVVLTGTGGLSRGEQVSVTLRRSGPAIDESQLTALSVRFVGLAGDRTGRESRVQVRWDPGETEQTVSAPFDAIVTSDNAGGASGGAIIASIDRDAIEPDNTYRLPLAVLESLRVGIVARQRFERGLRADDFGPPEWLKLALSPTESTPIDTIDIEPTSIDTPTLASIDALLLPSPDVVPEGRWQTIRRFADEGGLVIVFPASDVQGVQLWSDAFTSAMGLPWRIGREPVDFDDEPSRIAPGNSTNPLIGPIAAELDDLLSPVTIFRALPPTGITREADVVLRLDDGTPWFIASATGDEQDTDSDDEKSPAQSSRGLVVYIASAMDLAWTDLPARPLMVPLFQELVRQGFGTSSGTRVARAGTPVLAPARSSRVRALESADIAAKDSATDTTVSPAGFVAEPLRTASLYEAHDAAGRSRGLFAVNADTDGARTDPQTEDAIGNWLSSAMSDQDSSVKWIDAQSPADAISEAAQGSTIGWPLLLAGLVLALLETVMARYFSHAFRERAAPSSRPEALAA